MEESVTSNRPYWHVDAKWISGLLLFAAWSLALLVLALHQLTAPENAIPAAGQIMAGMTEIGADLSREEQDEESPDEADSLASFQQQILEAGDRGLHPFPGMSLTVTMDDLEGKSEGQFRTWLFTQVAEDVYWHGAETIEESHGESSMLSTLGLMALFTDKTHQRIGRLLLPLAVINGFLLIMLIFFSAGGGRLVSPGVVLLFSSLPGMAGLLLSLSSPGINPTEPAATRSALSALAEATSDGLILAAEAALRVYTYSFLTGLVLLVLGILLSIGLWTRRKRMEKAH